MTTQHFRAGEHVELRVSKTTTLRATGGGSIVGAFVVEQGFGSSPAQRVELAADGRSTVVLVVPPAPAAAPMIVRDSVANAFPRVGLDGRVLCSVGGYPAPATVDRATGFLVPAADPSDNARTIDNAPPAPIGVLRFVATFDGAIEVIA